MQNNELGNAYTSGVDLAGELKEAGFKRVDIFENHISENNSLFKIVKTSIKVGPLDREYNPNNFLKDYKPGTLPCPDFKKLLKSSRKISVGRPALFLNSQDLKIGSYDSAIIPHIKPIQFRDLFWLIENLVNEQSNELAKNDKLYNIFYCKKDDSPNNVDFVIPMCFSHGELCIGKYLPNEHKKYRKGCRVFSIHKNINSNN